MTGIVPTPQPITEETWYRFKGTQRFRDRRFVESGGERARLIALGFITPAKKAAAKPASKKKGKNK